MVNLPTMYPDLERNFTPTASGSTICSYSKDVPGHGPIMALIHGYPQSAYIWRYVCSKHSTWTGKIDVYLLTKDQMVPELIPSVSVFVPELPSYGVSSPTQMPLTKRLMGDSILEALCIVFSLPSRPNRQIFLLGHDRGARIAHRLAVDFAHPNSSTSPFLANLDLRGVALMDILPLKVQWAIGATVPTAAVAYFHWPFLAHPDMAIPMIKAYGGDTFCRNLLVKGCGTNETGRASFFAGDSAEIYARNFATEDAIKGACEDYIDGATTDVQLQEDDEEMGRKVAVPVLLLWSLAGIGRWGDVGEMWKKDWIAEGVRVETLGIGDGVGHYLAEEAPAVVTSRVTGFLESLGVKMG